MQQNYIGSSSLTDRMYLYVWKKSFSIRRSADFLDKGVLSLNYIGNLKIM